MTFLFSVSKHLFLKKYLLFSTILRHIMMLRFCVFSKGEGNKWLWSVLNVGNKFRPSIMFCTTKKSANWNIGQGKCYWRGCFLKLSMKITYMYSKTCHLRPPLLPQKSGRTWQLVSQQRDTSKTLSTNSKLFSTRSFNDKYCLIFISFWDILPCMLTTLNVWS